MTIIVIVVVIPLLAVSLTLAVTADVDDCIIVIAVVIPLLAVSLSLAVIAAICMRRRSFVDWTDDEKKCSARAVNVSQYVRTDGATS